MADTGKKHYSKNESLNRILRALIGKPAPSDIPDTLAGSVASIDEALSKMAEVFEGNDPEETLFVPNAMSSRFGEIYAEITTGSSQSLVTGTWTLVSGFSGNGLSSDGITPDQANNRITINKAGTYFVGFGVSMEAANGTATTFHFEVALDGVRQGAVSAKRGLGASGAITGNLNAYGFVTATAGQNLTLEVLTQDANRILQTYEMQLNALKVA